MELHSSASSLSITDKKTTTLIIQLMRPIETDLFFFKLKQTFQVHTTKFLIDLLSFVLNYAFFETF